MALYSNLCKTYRGIVTNSYAILNTIQRNVESTTATVSLDTVDDFTTQLIERQSSKWENVEAKSAHLKQHYLKTSEKAAAPISVQPVNDPEQMERTFAKAILEQDVRCLVHSIDACTRNAWCPSENLIVPAFSLCSQNGKVDSILALRALCENHHPDFTRANFYFDAFFAEALWMKGDVIKSLDLFDKVYRSSKSYRRRVNLILKYLILNSVFVRSEATLLNIVKFCKRLHKDFDDSYLLSVVWQMCFLSDWFSDQCTALELLEYDEKFCKTVLIRVPFVVSVALNNHQTDLIYRLLEFLLRRDMKVEYSNVLDCLFDYKIRQRDIRSCREIVQWSDKYSVKLSSLLSKQFIVMLLEQMPHAAIPHLPVKKVNLPECHFKF